MLRDQRTEHPTPWGGTSTRPASPGKAATDVPDAMEPLTASMMVMIMPTVSVAPRGPGSDLCRMRGTRNGQDQGAVVVTFGRMMTAGWRPA